MKNKTQKLVLMALLSAISVILLMTPFLRMPLIPAAPYLVYDAMDIPILIGGFWLGPVAGLIITLVGALIQGVAINVEGGLYGILMHLIATGVFVTTASLIYRKKKTIARMVTGLVFGTLAMTLIMIPANLIITPLFLGAPVSAVKEMILPVIVPFNLLKAGINSVITFLIYLPISKMRKK